MGWIPKRSAVTRATRRRRRESRNASQNTSSVFNVCRITLVTRKDSAESGFVALNANESIVSGWKLLFTTVVSRAP
jgi:hypothetical protein